MQAEFRARGATALRMGLWGTKPAVYFRDPDSIATIGRGGDRFGKLIDELDRLHRFSGAASLFVLRRDDEHAALRSVMAPFFGAASIKALAPIFVEVADDAVDAALLACGGGAGGGGAIVDLETITRRAMLDVIGRTAFGYDFEALALLRGDLAARAGSPRPPPRAHQAYTYARASDGGAPPMDVVDIVGGLYFMAMVLTFNPPLPDALLPGYARYVAGIEQLEACVARVLQDYGGDPVPGAAPSLLGCLIAARDARALDGAVDNATIRDNLLTFMIAGSDTVATTLALALFELAHHPETQAAVVAELDAAGLLGAAARGAPPPPGVVLEELPMLSAVIKETLRMYPPAPSTGRLALGDDVVGGYFIEAGTQVVIDLYNMHRSERYWPRPDEWLPDRWLSQHAATLGPTRADAYAPYGVGARACIGKVFANVELHYVLARVLSRLEVAAVPECGPHVQLHKSFTLRSEKPLVVSFRERE